MQPARVTRDRASEAEVAAFVHGARSVPTNPASFVSMALRHRMAALLVHEGISSQLPREQAARLVGQARAAAVIGALRDRELCRVLCALEREGIDVLLMKGAHLAYSHYEQPYLRERDDADLLIAPEDRTRVARALEREGYRRLPDITTDAVLGQMMFDRAGSVGALLDVHWRIVARRVACDLLGFEELRARAVPLPRLGRCARGPSPADALALASIHQSAHHPEHDLLLWAHDTHLLVTRFTEAETERFFALAVDRRMTRLAQYALDECVRFFPTPQASALLARLAAVSHHERTAFLVEPRTPLADLASDLTAASGWVERLRLAWGHLVPPPAYMRVSYGAAHRGPLPWLYVRRMTTGGLRWLKRGLTRS
jgi:putative nucleotidyltransferase-like protein